MGATIVAPEEIHAVDCDIFSPCALGGVLNDETIPQIKAPIVAGAANNQLQEPRHAEALAEAGILYAPDYAINPEASSPLPARLRGRARTQRWSGSAGCTTHCWTSSPRRRLKELRRRGRGPAGGGADSECGGD